MWFPNFWFDVYVFSQNLQSYFPISIIWIWVLLCCLRYLFCVKVFPHVSLLNIITGAFFYFHYVSATNQLVFLQIILPCVHIVTLFTLKLAIQMRFFVSCKHTFSHTGVTNIALLNCVDICNMLVQNICSVEFSSTNVIVGLVLMVVFPIVLVKTKWTAEFFSTIVTLILDVDCSKSGMQLKSLWIFKTVSTFDFWKTLNLVLIQILFATFYSFGSF